MSHAKAGAVIHRNLAVIAFDTSGTLKETVHRLADLDLDSITLGDRHLVLPSSRVGLVLERLKQLGQFPRLVGEPPVETVDESGAEAHDEEEG